MTKAEKMQRIGMSMEECMDWLLAVADEAMMELDELDIPYSPCIRWKINTRAQRWGLCRRLYELQYEFEIELNISLFADGAFDGLKNTIIHELLHTCPDCMKHTGMWKKYADMVNRMYGYNVKRTSSEEDKCAENINHTSREDKIKYILRCKGCGNTWKYARAGKFVKIYNRCHCGKCGGALELITL